MRTCADCGSCITKKNQKSIKSEQEKFPADFSPLEHYKAILHAERARAKLDPEAPEYPLPYLFNRASLVQKMLSTGKKLGQTISTMHLAVRYFDRTFSICQSGILPASYDLIALGCLVIAAKFDELDMNIPMMMDFICISKAPYSYENLRSIESELLTILEFDLMQPTVYICLKALLACGVVYDSDKKKGKSKISEKSLVKVREYAYFFGNTVVERKIFHV